MAGRAAPFQQDELVQQVLTHFFEFKFIQGWRLWVDFIHRSSYGVQNIPQPLPEPTNVMKIWGSLLLTMWLVATLSGVGLLFIKDAIKADLTPDGRFREVYAIPSVIQTIKSVFVTLNPMRLRRILQ